MKISVIIPTYNGGERISNLLDSLKRQTLCPSEIIIVIDGSNDNTKEIIYASSLVNCKVIEQENKGRAITRNTGVKNSTGDLLIFYDDDMRPNSDSVLQHFKFHQEYANCICGGIQLEDLMKTSTDIQKFKAHLSRKWFSKYHSGLNKLKPENLFLTAANFSIKKNSFLELGGFNEKLNDAEDIDLAIRSIKKGFEVYLDTNNIGWHDDFISCKSYIKRQREYFKANNELKENHPKQEKYLNIKNLKWFKRWLFRFFSLQIWIKWIDSEKLKWLPKKIKFKIYDLVITSLGTIFIKKNI